MSRTSVVALLLALGAGGCGGTVKTGAGGTDAAAVPATHAVQALAAVATHACAIVDGAVYCWGDNSLGQIGSGTVAYSAVAVAVRGIASGATAIAAGDEHTCAVVGAGVQCWGWNDLGQLGNPATASCMPGADAGSELAAPVMACSATPVPVAGLPGPVTAIAAGYTHTCALSGGGVWCWGNDSAGQLGNGKQGTTSAAPVQVMGLEAGVDAIAAGGTLTCALTGGRVLCWGSDAATTGSLTPRDVGLAAADAISVGSVFACAISAGAMSCWGSDADGELGNGMAMTSRATPAPVSGLATGVKLVAAGWRHACAVQATSTLCWGANDSGQIGDGSMETRSVPVAVARLPGPPEKLAGGASSTCAVASGKVYCWGGSPVAPLSAGDDAGSAAPAEVDGLPL